MAHHRVNSKEIVSLFLVLLFTSGLISANPVSNRTTSHLTQLENESLSMILGQERSYWPTHAWATSTPEAQEMSSLRLDSMIDLIYSAELNVDSVIIVRNGLIVLEEYPDPNYSVNTLHMIQSCTKQFTSTLVGIAIEHGFIESVDAKVVDFFTDWDIENLDDRKRNITIRHLLEWTDGLDWHEIDYPYDDPRNTLGQMWVSDNAVKYCLDRPMVRNPGESWYVNSGTMIIAGGLITRATGLTVPEFAEEYLFGSLGIDSYYWSMIGGGRAGGWYHSDGGLYLTPRDMAKYGYLMLNNGTWDEEQIVSPQWVEYATSLQVQTTWGEPYTGFGYQWYVMPSVNAYAALGHYQQSIFVVPEHDLVVVFTGNIADGDWYPDASFLQSNIIPAITQYSPSESVTAISTGSPNSTTTTNGYGPSELVVMGNTVIVIVIACVLGLLTFVVSGRILTRRNYPQV
jgi:CubicO group peptidase (beta-lactamase class C family)